MNDPALSRLDLLRFLERVQVADLERTHRWIDDEKRRELERRQGEQARPEPPGWLIEYGLNRDSLPTAVHTGECTMTGKRSEPTDSDTIRRALAADVKPCSFCRLDTELSVLDQGVPDGSGNPACRTGRWAELRRRLTPTEASRTAPRVPRQR